MAFDWKRLVGVGVTAGKILLPGGTLKDNVLDNVNAIINSETVPNEEATKITAAALDALAKEVKKLRSDVDALKKAK